jgi:hypothetical protein
MLRLFCVSQSTKASEHAVEAMFTSRRIARVGTQGYIAVRLSFTVTGMFETQKESFNSGCHRLENDLNMLLLKRADRTNIAH